MLLSRKRGRSLDKHTHMYTIWCLITCTLENIEQPFAKKKEKALNNLDLTKGKRGLLLTAVRAKDKEK